MTSPPRFRRIIFGLRPGPIDRRALELSAEMANLLGAALQGVYIEDEALKELADFSRIREFHLLRREWRPIDANRMAEDIELAARSAKQLINKIALERGVTSIFDVLSSGSVGEFLRLTHPHDIVVISAADSPRERLAALSFQFSSLSQTSSTTMLLPRRVMRRKGPVIGMISLMGDSTLRVAATIAHAADERLLLVVPAKGLDYPSVLEAAHSAGVARNKIDVLMLARNDTQNFLAAIGHISERMIVLPRLNDEDGDRIDPSTIVSVRSTPVILVDPMAIFQS